MEIYEKAFSESFQAKQESLQYNATLAITGAIRGSFTEKNYEELGLESLESRRWYRKMRFFCIKFSKVNHRHTFLILYQKVIIGRQHKTRNSGKETGFLAKHNYFKNSFFPSAITKWNKLDCYIRHA